MRSFRYCGWRFKVGCCSAFTSDAIQNNAFSGGLLLKHSGRIGEVRAFASDINDPDFVSFSLQAAVYGAGCWAQLDKEDIDERTLVRGIACSVSGIADPIALLSLYTFASGAGENIIQSSLAKLIGRTAGEALSSDQDIHNALEKALTVDLHGMIFLFCSIDCSEQLTLSQKHAKIPGNKIRKWG